MGRKTNWNPAEDQTLTRAWLSASDLQLHGGASNFWDTVHDLFHKEVDTERPLTGLKVRWTRINRESQKFAAIFHELQSQHTKQTEENGDDSDDAAAVALLKEQQWIDEAKSTFHRFYSCKFSFEACWKQLRYSTKWLQLCANSEASHSVVVVVNSLNAGTATETVKTSPPSSVQHEIATDPSAHSGTSSVTADAGDVASSTGSPTADSDSDSEVPTASVAAAAAVAAVAEASTPDSTTFAMTSGHKRRADASLEALGHVNNQVQGLASTLVDELRRQNDLMEDQNAIALFKVDGDMIGDAETRHCYQLLRARYLKRIRANSRSYSNGNNGRSTTSV